MTHMDPGSQWFSALGFSWVLGTCHLAAVGHAHGTEAVVGNGRDLPGTPRPVVVVAVGVRVRHGIRVVGVQVVTALRTLRGLKINK